jgi:hypothetical protein
MNHCIDLSDVALDSAEGDGVLHVMLVDGIVPLHQNLVSILIHALTETRGYIKGTEY